MLSPALYDIFRENLLFDWEFVRENTDLTYDGQVWDCALIRTTDRKKQYVFPLKDMNMRGMRHTLPIIRRWP